MKKAILCSMLLLLPLMVWGTTPYKKDANTGVITVNCEGTVELLAVKRPTGDTPADKQAIGEWVKNRNHTGRVWIPNHNQPWDVIVRTGDKLYVVASGITNSPTVGKGNTIYLRIRQEEEVAEPKAPIAEVIE